MRPTPEGIERRFKEACETPSDINEHLPLLRQLASECEHVTEMGMREANASTVAFLAAQPLTFVSWDINPFAVVSQQVVDLLVDNMSGRTRFQPRVGDTLEIKIEQTDLLFIDTLHTASQLWRELVRHADPKRDTVRKYLVLHDTAETGFGWKDEVGGGPGLRPAIRQFQKHHAFPLWRLIEDRQNNNGLAVLRHARWDP